MSALKFDDDSEYYVQTLKKVGARLRSLRESLGEINYERFAAKNNLNRTQLWRYENGEDFNFTSLLKVMKALKISVKDFFSEGFDELPE